MFTKMHLALFILASFLVAASNTQFNSYGISNTYYPDQRFSNNNFFPGGAYNYLAQPSFGRSPAFAPDQQLGQARTITLFLANPATSITISTVYTTCTTAIAAASSCVESGSRRRRGMPPAKMLFAGENDEKSLVHPLFRRYYLKVYCDIK